MFVFLGMYLYLEYPGYTLLFANKKNRNENNHNNIDNTHKNKNYNNNGFHMTASSFDMRLCTIVYIVKGGTSLSVLNVNNTM